VGRDAERCEVLAVAMGRCIACDRLVFIRPRGYKDAGSRERWWYPVEHDDETGRPCVGVKRGI
jgi:hypothetical protein